MGGMTPIVLAGPDIRELATEQEVAEFFRVSPRTVRRWSKSGTLRPVRVGGTTRYRISEIQALLDSQARFSHQNDTEPQAARPEAPLNAGGGGGRGAG